MKRSVVFFSILCLMSFAGRMSAQVSLASIHEPKSSRHSAKLLDQPKKLIPPSRAMPQEPLMEPPRAVLKAQAMPTLDDDRPLHAQPGCPSPSHTPNAMHATPSSSRLAPVDISDMTRPVSVAAHHEPTVTVTGQSGTVGDNIQWKLENGTLTFSGEGEVKEIVDWTEVAQQVTDVVFEEGITGICASFFYNTGYFYQAVSLALPASLTHIDANAFLFFFNLQTVTIASITPPQLDPSAFYYWPTLVVPEGYSQAYKNVYPWYCFSISDPGTFACGDGLTCSFNAVDHYLEVYGEGPMWADVDLVRGHETDIQRISISEGVTSLADRAFENLSLIESVDIPLSVQQIGAFCFAGDTELRTVDLRHHVSSIGQGAFQDCSALSQFICVSPEAPQLGANALTTVAETGTLFVPQGSDYSSWMAQLPDGWTAQYADYSVSGKCGEQVIWSFDTATGLLTISGEGSMNSAPWNDYSNSIESVEISNGITSLAPQAFQNCSYLKTITIPKSVTVFGEDSVGNGGQFEYCSSLSSVIFEDGSQLTNIPSNAFSNCSNLQSITIPKSVTVFGEDSDGNGDQFCFCSSLTSVTFEDGSQLTNISSFAFSYCSNLQSIVIPKSVTIFGEGSNGYGYQFASCSSLSSVTFEDGSQLTNISSYAFNNCNNLQSIVIPKSVTIFGEDSYGDGYQFASCSSLSSVTFEDDSQLTNIPAQAFCYCEALQSITIPKSVTTFGENSNGQGLQFDNCSSLSSVTFESGSRLTNIPSFAFNCCHNLQSITIPQSVTIMGEGGNGQGAQFAYCSSLKSVTFESGSQLTNIPSFAFYYCDNLQSITVPKSVNEFGEDSNGEGCQFESCLSLNSVIFENGSQLTKIASRAFYYCEALQSVTIPKSVTTFGENSSGCGYQFSSCSSLSSVTFESGSQLTNIPSYAFFRCNNLQSITIPTSVTIMGEGSNGQGAQFANCSSLSSVTFESGSQLTNVSSYAFYYCSSLQSITVLTNEVPSLSMSVFSGLPETGILTTHAGKDYSSWMEQLPEGWTMNQVGVFTPGDVDGDGEVSISDALGIINFIIHRATEGLDEQAADMNGDGIISVADAVMVVNTVLNVNGASANGRRLVTADADATLAMSPMKVAKNTVFDLPVILNGTANAFTALQSSLHLPQGVTLTEVTSTDDHTVRYAEQEDGSICVVSLSLSNATFAGNGDAIFILHLQTDDTFEGGLVMLDEMEIVMPSLHASRPTAVGALLTEGATTIGDIPLMDDEHTEYDLSGRVGQGMQGVYIVNGKKYYR